MGTCLSVLEIRACKFVGPADNVLSLGMHKSNVMLVDESVNASCVSDLGNRHANTWACMPGMRNATVMNARN